MQHRPDYKFYASLLDKFWEYENSDSIWEQYWGFSENPKYSPEEFHEEKFKSLIDSINRVPFDSEAADKGTAFNEVIDCIVLHQNSTKMQIVKVRNEYRQVTGVKARYNGREFYFPLPLVREVSNYYDGGLCQQYVQAMLPTAFGMVMLYGYIDYLMPFCTHDLKTTGRYMGVGMFKNHFQHLVYPYALMQNGCDVREFEYNIVEMGKTYYETFTESYLFRPERDIPKLQEHCEELIKFLRENRSLIKNEKIFGLR